MIEVVEHALDRVPLALIIDDSTPLVNLNYFFIRDRVECTGENQRWEDVPVTIPEFFVREWAEWCAENGVKGKFSVVPCPAGLGRIDEGLPLFGAKQVDSWLGMCRELIAPSFDITPEMLTHTFVLDLETMRPLSSRIWEQYEWQTLPSDLELVTNYIATACQILVNVGLTPTGVTSPGGFGGRSMELYAKAAGEAVRLVTGNPTPFFFKRVYEAPPIPTPVWYPDREQGTAVGEIIAGTGDWTGGWTGYSEVNVDKYITADLQGGRLPALINAKSPAVLCSHWQGFYGMHNDDRRGFYALKTVVARLRERDPHGEYTRWRKVSEITNYACARELAKIVEHGDTVVLDLPIPVPEFTLKVTNRQFKTVRLDGKALTRAGSRRDFRSGTYYSTGKDSLLAFDATSKIHTLEFLL